MFLISVSHIQWSYIRFQLLVFKISDLYSSTFDVQRFVIFRFRCSIYRCSMSRIRIFSFTMSDSRFHNLRFCEFRFTFIPISDFSYPIVLGSMSELLFPDVRFISYKIRYQIIDTFNCRCSICWLSDFSNHYLFCISIVGFRFCFVSNFQFRFVGRCLISSFDFRNYFGLLPALP